MSRVSSVDASSTIRKWNLRYVCFRILSIAVRKNGMPLWTAMSTVSWQVVSRIEPHGFPNRLASGGRQRRRDGIARLSYTDACTQWSASIVQKALQPLLAPREPHARQALKPLTAKRHVSRARGAQRGLID